MAIQRALELRSPLEKLFALPQWDKAGKTGLRRLKLSADEWSLLTELDGVLGVRILSVCLLFE